MSNEARKQCGQRLQAARVALGLTRPALGKLIRDYSQITIYRWETGSRMPSYEDRILLAEVVGFDPWAVPVESSEKAS